MNISEYEYTRFAKEMMEDIEQEFKAYSREALQAQLDKLYSKSKKDSDYKFIEARLVEMLEVNEVKGYNLASKADMEAAIQSVPSADDIYYKVFCKLHEIFKDFKTPADYMERLVKKLCDKEFVNDSVRLAIVKQFIKHTEYNTKEIIEYVTKDANVKEGEEIEYTLSHIDEKIFDNLEKNDSEDKPKREEILSDVQFALIARKVLKENFSEKLKAFTLTDVLDGIQAEIFAAKEDEKEEIRTEYKDTVKSLLTAIGLFKEIIAEDACLEMSELESITEDEYKDVFGKINLLCIINAMDEKKLPSEFVTVMNSIKQHVIKRNNKLSIAGQTIMYPVPMCSKEAFELIAKSEYLQELAIHESKRIMHCFRFNDYNKDWSIEEKINFIIEHYDKLILSTEYEKDFEKVLNAILATLMTKMNEADKKKFNKKNNSAKKTARNLIRDKQQNWDLLQLADSLASGEFYTNGKTRNDLYMFDFEFNIRFYISPYGKKKAPVGVYDENRDIDKNLFHDYYNCNLLNYIAPKGSKNNNAVEPTGAGINIKNFVEVIYLYYLNKNDLSAREKISRAQKCIKNCKERFRDAKKIPSVKQTKLYYDTFRDVLDQSEEKLVDYICDGNKFYFDKENNYESAINFANEEVTASKWCMKILDKIEQIGGEFFNMREECGIGASKSKEDIDEDNKRRRNKSKDKKENDESKDKKETYEDRNKERVREELCSMGINDEKFTELVANMNRMMEQKIEFFKADCIDIKALQRTHLISLAFYYKMVESEKINRKERDFSTIYNDFCKFVNPKLQKSRYQMISSKNIFDVFTVLNLYRLSGDVTP